MSEAKSDSTVLLNPVVGDRVIDDDGNVGTITDADDLHNIYVELDGGGSGFYCLHPDCGSFDSLKRI